MRTLTLLAKENITDEYISNITKERSQQVPSNLPEQVKWYRSSTKGIRSILDILPLEEKLSVYTLCTNISERPGRPPG
jgi:hypothetical protein